MEEIPFSFREWIKQCVKEEFGNLVSEYLDKDETSEKIVRRATRSKKMDELVSGVRDVLAENVYGSTTDSCTRFESRPVTSVSLGSELSLDDWEPLKNTSNDPYVLLLEKIQRERPVHVRLAAYEALIKSEPSTLRTSTSWPGILECLGAGIEDENRAIFEASSKCFAKILSAQPRNEAHLALIATYESLWRSRKSSNDIPTSSTGINFKIFSHEKLVRVTSLLTRYQEYALKIARSSDKFLEETIGPFASMLASQKMLHPKLNAMNLIAVLDPCSEWTRRWMHGISTQKLFLSAVKKYPTLLLRAIEVVRTGLEDPPSSITARVTDETRDVHVFSDTIKTLTYLNALSLVSQLCCTSAGRRLLSELEPEEPMNLTGFTLALLHSLNDLAESDKSIGVYSASRAALRSVLSAIEPTYDARFHRVAMTPLLRVNSTERKMYPHTIDALAKILDTDEGSSFVVARFLREGNALVTPARYVIEYASMLLRQPLSVMDVAHVVDVLTFVARLFDCHRVCQAVSDTLETQLYPAIAHLYARMDKYSTENESKTRTLDSAIKHTLWKIVSAPLGLMLLTREESVFEGLLRASAEPLRSSWNCHEVIGFLSAAALSPLGLKILSDIAPHFMAKVLKDVYGKLEDPKIFHDPWDDDYIIDFFHVLALLSMNIDCFVAVMNNTNEESYPHNFHELLKHSEAPDSMYHGLALRVLRVFSQNLNAYLYLEHRMHFKEVLLGLQNRYDSRNGTDSNPTMNHIIDEDGVLRTRIVLGCHYIGERLIDFSQQPENCTLFSTLPPPEGFNFAIKLPTESTSRVGLGKFLEESHFDQQHSEHVTHARKFQRLFTDETIQHSLLVELVEQIQDGITTFKYSENYAWPRPGVRDQETLLPEEILGIDCALMYAEQNQLLQPTPITVSNLHLFLRETHAFIEYERPTNFRGFDWFLATIFVICGGNLDRCKSFVVKIVRFPSIVYVWPALGKAVSQRDNVSNSDIIFAQALEDVVAMEFPRARRVLKSNCGIDWWMLCNAMISQCFWSFLPWREIVHVLSICLLYPPDYFVYYCSSLLHHAVDRWMDDVTNGNRWPETLDLSDFRCCDYFQVMERLSKKHRNNILPMLTAKQPEDR